MANHSRNLGESRSPHDAVGCVLVACVDCRRVGHSTPAQTAEDKQMSKSFLDITAKVLVAAGVLLVSLHLLTEALGVLSELVGATNAHASLGVLVVVLGWAALLVWDGR